MTNAEGAHFGSVFPSGLFPCKVLATLALFLASCNPGSRTVKFETAYQAVFLDSGSVFFGRLEGLGTDYPV